MKVSELIKELQAFQITIGDIDIYAKNEHDEYFPVEYALSERDDAHLYVVLTEY